MGIRAGYGFLLFVCCFLFCHTPCSSMQSFLKQGESLKYPDQLFSVHGKFVLRFFMPHGIEDYPQTYNVFLGLFYNNKSSYPNYDPLWLADRYAIGTVDGSANLTLGNDGSLKILYEGGRSFVLYSSPAPSNFSVVLKEDGNLVLREFNPDGSSKQDLWQSFDHPTNTLLPGMKLGFNHKTGKNLTLTSQIYSRGYYKSGSYALGVDPSKMEQLAIWWLGDIYWTSGYGENKEVTSKFHYVSNENETYFIFSPFGDIFNTRLLLDNYGGLQLFTSDFSDQTGFGVYCHSDSNNRANGCMENFQRCSEVEFYVDYTLGIMSSSGSTMSKNWTMWDCQQKCEKDCFCVAYASVDDTCVMWSRGSTFREASASDGGQYIHLKSKYPSENHLYFSKSWIAFIGGFTLEVALILIVSWSCFVVARRYIRKAARRKQKMLLREIGGDRLPSSTKRKKENKTERELQIFKFKTIVSATNNFCHENQLGKGGYGPVYKGRLPDGHEIAIKRLSTSSGQGLVEFKKEAILIAKLQHTNLVRLLGFCVQGEEKALVYEYMPNKSLDFHLFDSERKKMLNWKKRFIIIEGVVQGLVYLHKYSRLKVIHRDLKAGNILLDSEMNPKISDFGMARLLAPGDSEENTNRIVGTFGYMPPEYALQGTVSTKTDVFSFGILLLEIVSGRKNNSRYHLDHPLNLTGYAWTLWKEGNGVELIDPSLHEFVPRDEVMRCIQVGLLCVQDQASNRPTMIDVVFMLSTENAQLPLPRKPAFFINSIAETQEEAQTLVEIFSINELTTSIMEVR